VKLLSLIIIAGQFNESALDKETHTILHGESKHVRVRENFHLLHPVNETIEGSSLCFILADVTEFKLLKNGSLLLMDLEKTIDIDQFCVKSEVLWIVLYVPIYIELFFF
jgi:hypothetical protein